MLKRLQELADEPSESGESPFDSFEEGVLPSVAFDLPDYFQSIAHLLNHRLFHRIEVKYVMMHILDHYERYHTTPTRPAIHSQALRGITVDDTNWDVVRNIIDRPADHRDLPLVKDKLHEWARKKSYGLLYDPEAIAAYQRGDYAALENIINSAGKISDISAKGFWFYEQYDELYLPDNSIHMPTGFPQLDAALNNGGPSPGEVVCWLAATNVGKSFMLCNNAIFQSMMGHDVLLITFELDQIKTALRCVGVLTGVDIKNIAMHKDMVRTEFNRAQVGNNGRPYGRICIFDMPPDECSVNDVYSIIHTLRRTRGWQPKVVVLDYLDLMVSRRDSDNKDDYTRQKSIANQVRGLARNEKLLTFTATQGNRSANDTTQMVDLNKLAESYGKSMSTDYVVSLNQTPDQYLDGALILFIAKNRNGPKRLQVQCTINYTNMRVLQRTG